MDLSTLQSLLSELPLGQLYYDDVLDSTNARALSLAEKGVPHLSLVVADEQTAGRGRLGRSWFTPPGAALAFSLVLRPEVLGSFPISRLTGLGALAVCEVLQHEYGLQAQIKWPNDVLVGGKKLAGVLVETHWLGGELQSAVLGIGINIAHDSIPPESDLDFPATCVEITLGRLVNRWIVLKGVLEVLLRWLPIIDQSAFLQSWERNLAYQMEWVQLFKAGSEPVEGRLIGLRKDGSLRLELPDGVEEQFPTGEIHLRKVDRS
jgi:BirA family biotin operon repressor/biotin-[acetyl-CoA-carboxylase] ligase